MEELSKQELDQLVKTAPGGIVKLAFDDLMTILYTTDSFYSFIKSAADKINSKVSLALLRIVYSADIIYVTQQIAVQKHRKDNMLDINFRTLQQDGSFRWVMITGSKTGETYQSGTKTVPIYSCIAMDVTNLMVTHKKMEQTIEYHNKIAELSKELYFEYEIAKDTLSFNELFREVFGKEAIMHEFRSRLEKTKLIHSDELPAVISIYNSMMSGRKLARFELKLVPKDGIPCWYICYASMIFDENRNPYKVVGKLSITNHVDDEETEKAVSVYNPVLDKLTNVCTKESAESLITKSASEQKADALSALFLIDIKNYKGMNEVRKSINSENVLTGIGDWLIKHFRTSDIIGRLGLSEFVVYMKDVPSDLLVYETAEKLCEAIEEEYSYTYIKNGVSASIGITLHRGAHEYQSLMANSSAALAIAKKVSTSSFEIFSGAINS